MAVDEGCERDVVHRINEGYKALGVLKSVLNNIRLGYSRRSVHIKE